MITDWLQVSRYQCPQVWSCGPVWGLMNPATGRLPSCTSREDGMPATRSADVGMAYCHNSIRFICVIRMLCTVGVCCGVANLVLFVWSANRSSHEWLRTTDEYAHCSECSDSLCSCSQAHTVDDKALSSVVKVLKTETELCTTNNVSGHCNSQHLPHNITHSNWAPGIQSVNTHSDVVMRRRQTTL